jgi:hypothetical protein
VGILKIFINVRSVKQNVFINDEPKNGAFACLLVCMYSAVNGLTSASCEALAELRFRHLGQDFMKPGDAEDISQSARPLNA